VRSRFGHAAVAAATERDEVRDVERRPVLLERHNVVNLEPLRTPAPPATVAVARLHDLAELLEASGVTGEPLRLRARPLTLIGAHTGWALAGASAWLLVVAAADVA
jgi:hypothetical protein